MVSNAVAARLLDGTDQVVLWEQAHHAVAQDHETTIVVSLADGRTLQARCKPVDGAGRNVGVVIELNPSALADVTSKRRRAAEDHTSSPLVGESRAWQDVERLTRRVGASGLPILLVGEPGVGKTTLARYAHAVSGVGGDFIVHDAALANLDGTDTWLRHLRQILSNQTGTLFLRRLALLDGATAGAVCGLIDATADDGPRLMASAITDLPPDPGAQPLFDRLAVSRIAVPPLRNRPEDVRALANHFVRTHSVERPAPRLTPEVVQALLRLDWPGNVRQLDNVVRALVSPGRRSDIQLGDLPEDLRAQTARRSLTRLAQLELDQILVALRQAQGNKLEAAKALGISRSTLYRKLAASGIELDRSIF
jgi:DNA-binding NtrC family response regulator